MRLYLLLLVALLAIPSAGAAQPTIPRQQSHDPYYPTRRTPKLTTPQWVGEEGVDAVVILAIDDMRGHERWEAYLRPILDRLKRLEGRAPVSIMTCQIDPQQPHLQRWLKEGLSLETHTFDHPCPILRDGDLEKARATYERTVDLMAMVPGSRPVAFRTPCCDSLNTVSPRFFSEIFNRITSQGNYLTLDSSVFNLFTANDPELPRDLVLEADGRERFRKYLPSDRTFVNLIEDYPYPYVIGRLCWEFPCVTPSDWSAQHYQKPANPITLRDWKAALDATVVKKGVYCLVFHPYDWMRNSQIVELIDHAQEKYGRRVRFLNFHEAQERLNRHLLAGHPLRETKTGADNGIHLVDVNSDGYVDVLIDNVQAQQARIWNPQKGIYQTSELRAVALPPKLTGLKGFTATHDIRIGDETAVVGAKGTTTEVYFRGKSDQLEKAPFTLPQGARLPDSDGDHGLRFVDIDEDGNDDVVFSNEEAYGVYLFFDRKSGWSDRLMAGPRTDREALPAIARGGRENGFFTHSRSLWWQNEQTNLLRDHVDRRSFNELLQARQPKGKSPKISASLLKPRPGFVAQLMAAEPLVQDPIALAWGPNGRLWVVEMGDYPLGVDGKGTPGGRVKFLEDTDGDGIYDKATMFLDNIPFPTGVMPWRNGVLITAAPDILFAEDLDGDGKAERRTPLFTGFVPGNQQHRVNGLTWGVDGWVYGANGDSGGRVRSLKSGKEIDIRGRDFRIRPDTGEIEAVAGQAQYGRCRNDWGDWFGGNNANPMWHYALDDAALKRNPHVPPPEGRIPVSVAPGSAPVFPLSRTLPRFNDFHTANRFTSACSPIIYRDNLFGPAYVDNAFICEPVHNLVHREVMSPRGTTFTSRRATDEERSEFLASPDGWFRPTMVRVGPDGALWVCDMYRHVIEHPEWIPRDWQKKLDLRAGNDMGRIYRVFPVGVTPRSMPRLDLLDTQGLVAALDTPSGWQRDLVQQMILWRADITAVPALETLVQTSTRPQARLHGLATLHGLGALTETLLRRTLADPHPGVRREAIRLSEGRLSGALAALVEDTDAQVTMQLAYSLGSDHHPSSAKALGRLAARAAGDRYLTAAVMSSVTPRNLDTVLISALEGSRGVPPGGLVEGLLRLANAYGNRTAMGTLLRSVSTFPGTTPAEWQLGALAALLDTLDARLTSLADLARERDDLGTAVTGLARIFGAARTLAQEDKAPPEMRLAALRLLGRGVDGQKEDATLLADLLNPQIPEEIQAGAVAALGKIRTPQVAELLLARWKGFAPGRRGQVLEVLARREEWLGAVLDALEKKEIPASEIDAARRQRLLDHRDDRIRQKARVLFADAANPDRQKVISSYASVAGLPGDASRGQSVFAKTCAACHRLNGVGNEVGPDLAALTDRSSEALLAAVLDPNRAVEARYVNYVAETKNGLILTGVVSAETANSITLIAADGKPQIILRRDLESLTSSGKSAMPEGLEKDLPPQAMADLFAHLRAVVPPLKRKVFPGNTPSVIKPGGDGSLRLLASNGAIYGPTLVLESQYGNLGYWQSPEDHVSWTVELPAARRYEVWLDYACENGAAGKSYILESGGSRLVGKVVGTGTWDDYRGLRVGTLELAAGARVVTMRPEGKIQGPMIDLRGLRLVPVR